MFHTVVHEGFDDSLFIPHAELPPAGSLHMNVPRHFWSSWFFFSWSSSSLLSLWRSASIWSRHYVIKLMMFFCCFFVCSKILNMLLPYRVFPRSFSQALISCHLSETSMVALLKGGSLFFRRVLLNVKELGNRIWFENYQYFICSPTSSYSDHCWFSLLFLNESDSFNFYLAGFDAPAPQWFPTSLKIIPFFSQIL